MKTQSVFSAVRLIHFFSTCSAALFFVVPSVSSAGQVAMAQWIPWGFLSEEILKKPLDFTASRTDWTFRVADFSPKASEFKMELKGSLSELAFHSRGAEARALNLSSLMTFGVINIDETLLKNVNGNLIRVRVQAQCQPFSVQVSNFSLAIQARYMTSASMPMPTPVLSGLQIQIPDKAWRISAIHCNGVQGLDHQIASGIQFALNNPENAQELLKKWIAPQLENLWRESWMFVKQENWQNFVLDSFGEPTDQGVFVYGHAKIKSPRFVHLPSHLPISNSSRPQLTLTAEGFEALAQESLAQISNQKLDLQKVSSFSQLMRNRFLQFFVWPDLLNFSRKTPVWISNLNASEMVNLSSDSEGCRELRLQTVGLIEIPRKGEVRKYIHWSLGLAGQLATEVHDSQLLFEIQNAQTQFNWKFDEDYVRRFQPKSWISKSAFRQAIQGLFEGRKFHIQLPVLQWGPRSLKLNDWRENNSLIAMDWT